MPGWEVLIPIGASLLGNALNKSSGSESVSRQPAPWQDPNAEELYRNVWEIMNSPEFAQRFQGKLRAVHDLPDVPVKRS